MATSSYGVTVNGFIRKRLAEIKADMESSLSVAWGIPISTKANSVIGQAVGVFAAAIDDIWQVAEDTYNAMYPHTATGTGLRSAVGFAGLTALNAAKTKIYCSCYGTPGTIITKGAQIQGADSSHYEAYEDSAISLSNAVTVAVTLAGVTSGATYSTTIAGTTIVKIAGANDTVNTVLVALSDGLPNGWSASVTNNVLTYTQADRINGAKVSVSTTLQLLSVGSPIVFYASSTGRLDPAIGSVTKIITQVAGWKSVANESAAYPGREVETDGELRQRYASTVSAKGKAMIESIQANLLEKVSGVAAALVFENTADRTDSDGRPPHSIEVIVQGGDAEDVAEMIWKTKAAGIDTFGGMSVQVTDSQGIVHAINFNRPTEIPVYLRCIVHEDPESGLASDATSTIAGYLMAQGAALPVGKDVVLQKLAAYCIQNVPGIGYIELKGSKDGVDYSANNIAIGVRELAVFNTARIEVTVAS